MYWLRVVRARIRGLLLKGSVEREMEEELRFHLRMRAQENVRRGMTPEEAERAALRSFGQWARVKEACRDVKGGGLVEALIKDVKFGARALGKNLGFTAVAALTLALGEDALAFYQLGWAKTSPGTGPRRWPPTTRHCACTRQPPTAATRPPP